MRSAIIALLLFWSAASSAATVPLTFDATNNSIADYEEEGFSFVPGPNPVAGIGPELYVIVGPQVGFDSASFTMSRNDGSSFDVLSMDVGKFLGPDLGRVEMTGTFAGGGSWFLYVETDGNLATYTSANGLYNSGCEFDCAFSTYFRNLTSLEFEVYGDPMSIDNIVVSTVPVPAAVWLFGSALAGLGWMRCKTGSGH